MLQTLKKYWKKDHYRRAALFALPASIAFLLYLIITGNFFVPEWFLDLILPAGFVGSILSGSTYIARPMDRDAKRAEKIGTLLFTGFGIVITTLICIAAKTIGMPFLGDFACVLFGIGNVSTFAGLGNRISSYFNKSIPKNERRSRIIGAAIGAAVGIALCIFAKAALVAAASVFIPGASIVMPAVLSTILFSTSVSSTGASAGDYVSKAYNYTKYALGYSNDVTLNERIEKQKHEYRGSTVGIVLGITAAIIITALMPHVVAGILAVAVTGLIIASCCSIIGGLCSRIGRMIDGATQTTIELAPKKKDDPSPQPASQPKDSNKHEQINDHQNILQKLNANAASESSSPKKETVTKNEDPLNTTSYHALLTPAKRTPPKEDSTLLTPVVSVVPQPA